MGSPPRLGLVGSSEPLRLLYADEAIPQLVVDLGLGHVASTRVGDHAGCRRKLLWLVCGEVDVSRALLQLHAFGHDGDALEGVIRQVAEATMQPLDVVGGADR